MTQLDELKRRFASADFLRFTEVAPEFVVVEVTTAFSSALIALQGAHVMTWQPNGQEPVIWLSKQAKFATGKSIRGGVPICWPWFGPHPTEAAYPGHGFARTIPWQLLDAHQLPDGRVRLEFEPVINDAARAQWPHPSTLKYCVTIGQELELELATTNTGSMTFQLSQSLHTYFAIGDIRKANVCGLAGCEYIDKADDGARKRKALRQRLFNCFGDCGTHKLEEDGMMVLSGETDCVYLATTGCCKICDPVLSRTILITSTGSRSTVVWNPWAEKAEKMGDFGPDGYLHMICVETANAVDDVIVLAPGATHRMAAQYRSILG
jgi:glucose-6-phosphate 1-epimerase